MSKEAVLPHTYSIILYFMTTEKRGKEKRLEGENRTILQTSKIETGKLELPSKKRRPSLC